MVTKINVKKSSKKTEKVNKNAESFVRESEEKFRTIFENSRDGIMLVDAKSRKFIMGNNAFCQMIGYSSKEIIKIGVDNIHPQKDLPSIIKQFNRMVKGITKVANNLPVKRKNCEIIYVDVVASPIKISGKKYIMGSFRDITEKRKSEEEAKKLLLVIKHSLELVNISDVKGKMIFLNEAGFRMIGIAKKDLAKHNILDVIPKNLIALVKKELIPALIKGKIWQGDLQYLNLKTKKLFDVYVTAFPIKDEKTGEVLGFANVSLDITERKKQEIKTNEEKARVDAILAGLGEGLIVVGNDKKIQYINETAEEMLGWKNEELEGKSFFDVMVVDENNKPIPKIERPFYEAMTTGKKFYKGLADNIYYVKKDGKSLPVSITISPIILKGEIAGFVNVFRDIAEEKKVDEMKTEFVSLASHQLRMPITSINWNAEMLLNGDMGEINEEQKKVVNEIHRSNERMMKLVNALLNVSRLEMGTFIIEPEPINVVTISQKNLRELESHIKEERIEVVEKYDPEIENITADPKLLDIILQNLISNAVKYCAEKGKIEIEIIKNNNDIVIKVADNGVGIPKNQQKNIFTKLFRASNAQIKDPDGTGLGLYIVSLILKSINGKIWFESEEGKGAIFHAVIPLGGMKKRVGTTSLVLQSE